MRTHGTFSAQRIPLPSRIQVQSERERLQRREQRIGKLLRYLAACIALCLLLGTIAAVCFPVVRVADNVLAPTLCMGDLVLLLRTDKAAAGQLCAYSAENKLFFRREEDAASKDSLSNGMDAAQLVGCALLRMRRDMTLQLLS